MSQHENAPAGRLPLGPEAELSVTVTHHHAGITQVFLTGLVLGWVRWRSGSTTLTSLLHMLVNLGATVETIIKMGWSAT